MDRISVSELAQWQAAGWAFILIDVRRAAARQDSGAAIPGAVWKRPEDLFAWKDEVPRDRPAFLYCAHGHELSQGAAATLRALGLDARHLVDGLDGWIAAGRPTVPIGNR